MGLQKLGSVAGSDNISVVGTVSRTLENGDSVTVRSTEIWVVTIVGEAASQAGGNNDEITCAIDNNIIASSSSFSNKNYDNASASAESTFPFETVLEGGDTIKSVGGALHIGGFKIEINT